MSDHLTAAIQGFREASGSHATTLLHRFRACVHDLTSPELMSRAFNWYRLDPFDRLEAIAVALTQSWAALSNILGFETCLRRERGPYVEPKKPSLDFVGR